MTTTATIPRTELEDLSVVAIALIHSQELRERHPELNAALCQLAQAHQPIIQQIAQEWGTDEF